VTTASTSGRLDPWHEVPPKTAPTPKPAVKTNKIRMAANIRMAA